MLVAPPVLLVSVASVPSFVGTGGSSVSSAPALVVGSSVLIRTSGSLLVGRAPVVLEDSLVRRAVVASSVNCDSKGGLDSTRSLNALSI